MKSSILILTVVITTSLLTGTIVLSYGAVNPQIPSPREQMDKGISPVNVVCKAGLTLIIRASSDSAACVKKSSTDKMIENGWAKTVSSLLEKRPELSSIGDVKTLKIVPIAFDKKRLDTNEGIVTSYNYVFEACAKSNLIRTPEVLVTSDSETKSVKLSENIQPKSCQTSATTIKATDTNSIKASLVKKLDISIIIGELESKVNILKEKLAIEKKALSDLAKQSPPPSDLKKKVTEKTDKIITLRNELNVAQADLQKNQYSLIVGSKATPTIQPPIQPNEPVSTSPDGASNQQPYVTKIKTVPQFSDAGRLKSDPLTSSFNFIFSACAGKDHILFPEVMVRSDTEVKTVKMSAPLDSQTCQTTSTTIKAADANSIKGTMITSGDISKSITALENKIESLKESIAIDKKALSDIAKQTTQSDDFKQMVTELTDKIIKQRNELNQTKQELISLKYMIVE